MPGKSPTLLFVINAGASTDPSSPWDLRGKTAVVTGGSQGIGRAAARSLAGAGARVIIANRDLAAGEAAVAALRAEGCDVAALAVDVTSEASVVALFKGVQRAFGPTDILVNNAGITPKHPLLETTTADWDAIQATNTRGAFLCLREAARQMVVSRRGGRIVNVSSISSLHPGVRGNAAYAASKGALNTLTKAAALELAGHGVTVNAVLPGSTLTEGAQRPRNGAPVIGPATDPKRYLFGRAAQPDEPAAAILYFASPAAAMVTGQLLAIDGGFLVG